MLDLILFSSCFGITKLMSRNILPMSPPTTGTAKRYPSGSEIEGDSERHDRETYNKTREESLLHRISHVIFQTILILSLWLFCLSILEAAPASWLLFIHDTSSFVQCYRINLWTLCIMLEIAIPTFIGVMLVVKLSGFDAITSSSASMPVTPSKARSQKKQQSGIKREKYRLLLIGMRFIFVAVWYILKRIISTLLGRSQSATKSIYVDSSRSRRYCSAKVVLPVVLALSISFWILGVLSTFVISDSISTFSEGEILGERTHLKRKHNIGQYCLWIIGPHSPLKFMVKMACALGIIIASLLNGFGCASMPHANLVGMYLKPTSAAVLAKVEEDYFYAVQNLEEKRYMLSGLLQLTSANNIPVDNSKIKQLNEEINFLENLVGDMNDDIEEMKHSQRLAMKARTPVGRFSWLLGVIFSVLLIVRVLLAAFSILDVSASNKRMPRHRDPITIVVLWLTGHNFVHDEQYNLYLQGTSLILAGFLTITQVRNFFRVVGALGRKLSHVMGISVDTSKSQKTVGDLSLLLYSFVMGCYFLSCVVIVKMTLPIEYRSSFSAAVGKFDFGFNSNVLNIVFCSSTCTSAIILGFLFGIQRNNSERYLVESATMVSKGSFSQDASTHTA